MMPVRQVLTIIRKDVLTELRTRESITAMVVFAVMSIVMFNFALQLRVDTFRPLTPGVLWVTLVFAGTLACHAACRPSRSINVWMGCCSRRATGA